MSSTLDDLRQEWERIRGIADLATKIEQYQAFFATFHRQFTQWSTTHAQYETLLQSQSAESDSLVAGREGEAASPSLAEQWTLCAELEKQIIELGERNELDQMFGAWTRFEKNRRDLSERLDHDLVVHIHGDAEKTETTATQQPQCEITDNPPPQSQRSTRRRSKRKTATTNAAV